MTQDLRRRYVNRSTSTTIAKQPTMANSVGKALADVENGQVRQSTTKQWGAGGAGIAQEGAEQRYSAVGNIGDRRSAKE